MAYEDAVQLPNGAWFDITAFRTRVLLLNATNPKVPDDGRIKLASGQTFDVELMVARLGLADGGTALATVDSLHGIRLPNGNVYDALDLNRRLVARDGGSTCFLTRIGSTFTSRADEVRLKVTPGGFMAGGPAAGGGGVSRLTPQAGKWYFASNRTRSPIGSGTLTGSNNYMLGEIYLGDVPYAGTGYGVSLPGHFTINQGGDNEFVAENPINIQGVSIGVGPNTGNYAADRAAAVWTKITYNGAGSDTATIDPAVNPAGVIYRGPLNIPAGARKWCKYQFNVAPGAKCPYAYEPNTGIGEGQAGSTTDSLGAKLLDGSATNTSGRVSAQLYGPEFTFMIGTDGRPVVLCIGDSIGFGKNEVLINSGPPITGGAGVGRGGSGGGFLSRGLSDNVASKQFLGANICIPGSGPSDVSVNGRVKTQHKWNAIAAVTALNGGVLPFTDVLCEAATNSLSGSLAEFAAVMKGYYALTRAEWPGASLAQTTMICKATTTDGYQTVANQSVSTIDRTDGTRFLWNDKLMADKLDGAVDYAINTYQYTSDTTDRGKWAVNTPQATLQTALVAGTPVGSVMVNENTLSVGDFISLDVDTPGSVGALGGGAHISGITGTGPYQVFFNTNLTPANAQAIGAKVKSHLAADNAGLHPGTTSNIRTMKAITDWKNTVYP